MPEFTTKRQGAGEYTVHGPRGLSVRVFRNEMPGPMKWIAAAEWDRHVYSDPFYTKGEAVEAAQDMINTAASALDAVAGGAL